MPPDERHDPPSPGDLQEDYRYRCRVCGLRSSLPTWGEDGGSPGFTFCPCCGAMEGYQDCQPSAARRYRAQWLARGAPWEEPRMRPPDWNVQEQLRHVPPDFR